MAIVKTWEINKLERDLSDGFVNTAIYRVKAIDDSGDRAVTEDELFLFLEHG